MHLKLALELSPYDYAPDMYESPKQSIAEAAEDWNTFWLKCIANKGLGHLVALQKGTYLVDIDTLGETELEVILRQTLEEVLPEEWDEHLYMMCGGVCLFEQDILVLAPSCCGDMNSLSDWDEILDHASDTWTELWIGHPWVYYRRDKDMIEFSNYTEANATTHHEQDLAVMVRVSVTAMERELNKLKQQWSTFEFKFKTVLDKIKTSIHL